MTFLILSSARRSTWGARVSPYHSLSAQLQWPVVVYPAVSTLLLLVVVVLLLLLRVSLSSASSSSFFRHPPFFSPKT